MHKTSVAVAALSLLLGAGVLSAAETKAPTTAPSTQTAAKDGPPVNKFCAVEGGDNKVDPAVFTIYKGQKVGFCCKDCVKDFNKDPEKYVKNMK